MDLHVIVIWLWVKTNGTILGQAHHPFSSILAGIGMFTGGTIWLLTHGHMLTVLLLADSSSQSRLVRPCKLLHPWGSEGIWLFGQVYPPDNGVN